MKFKSVLTSRHFLSTVVASLLLLSSLSTANAVPANFDQRYAALIMDADTGIILHQENANGLRYPASLTKMMTLYLTFDALKRGKLTMDTMLPVSKKAASMPQTNLSLKPGDKISVRDAIKSVVVRSANDVAVVLAEAIGKTEWNFAVMMSAKARALGMKNTVFSNASGLPDSRQHSTAYDLAILGKALRTNHPDYFSYFKTESFVFKGKTYRTHNRVMTRYNGVDGIKTGYINASGFNLVTSVNKNGYHIVAVVMGGRTANIRDNQMIALLDRTFTKLASKEGSNNNQFAENTTVKETAEPAKNIKVAAREEEAENAAAQGDAIPAFDSAWGIQVGAFGDRAQAMKAVKKAITVASSELTAPDISVSESGSRVHRARIVSLSEDQARSACRKVIAHKGACFVYKADSKAS